MIATSIEESKRYYPNKYKPMINNLENKDILSDELLSVMDKLIIQLPHIVFGGSIALNAVGLLNRKINDIDIFVTNKQTLSNAGFLDFIRKETEINDEVSETTTDVNGILIRRTGFKINNVKICIFQVDDEQLQHSVHTVYGRKLKIQNINYAIMAKRAYADKTNKHKNDLNQIQKTLDDLPF